MATSWSLESLWPRVPPAHPVARDHLAMGVKGAAAVSWRMVSGMAHHDGDPLLGLLPLSSSSLELRATWSFLLLFAPLLFAKHDRARVLPIALRQRARGSKFSSRPQRACLVGAAKLVSHVCDSTCLAVKRRAGSGLRRARMDFFLSPLLCASRYRTPCSTSGIHMTLLCVQLVVL